MTPTTKPYLNFGSVDMANAALRKLEAHDEMLQLIDDMVPYARATIGAPESSWQDDNVILRARRILKAWGR
jgi:hypothetical protein